MRIEMGMYTTVSTYDDAGNQTLWQFKHGLDQCQFYDVGEVFGREVEHMYGRYDVSGVYDAFARLPDGYCQHAMVVVADGAVEEVVPVDLSDVEMFNPWRCPRVIAQARALAARHGVDFDEDGFGV